MPFPCAQLAAMTAAKLVSDRNAATYKETIQKCVERFQTLKAGYDELEGAHTKLQGKYKLLGEDVSVNSLHNDPARCE